MYVNCVKNLRCISGASSFVNLYSITGYKNEKQIESRCKFILLASKFI